MDKNDIEKNAKNLAEVLVKSIKEINEQENTTPLCPIICGIGCATVCGIACAETVGVALAETTAGAIAISAAVSLGA